MKGVATSPVKNQIEVGTYQWIKVIRYMFISRMVKANVPMNRKVKTPFTRFTFDLIAWSDLMVLSFKLIVRRLIYNWLGLTKTI